MKNKPFANTITSAALIAAFALLAACVSSPRAAAPTPTPPSPPAAAVDELDAAIREASDYLNRNIPKGNKVVFLNIRSDYPDLSEYILSGISENAVNSRVFSVVDRRELDTIRSELDFQYSGEVSDDSAQAIGRMLGAQTIVSGTAGKFGTLYRIQIKAIEVQSASVQGQWNKNVSGGATIAALTARHVPASAAAPAPRSSGTAAPAAQSQAPTTPAVSTPVAQTQRQAPENNLVGVWKGSYIAGQGETALILSVYEERGTYIAIFDFFNLPGKSNSREGKYYMQVTYNQSREKFYLKGTEWIEQPSGYGFADLEGTITRDVFSGFMTGTDYKFRVVRQE